MTRPSSVWERIGTTVSRARERRGANLLVVNLRILIGFAFIPAGLKKVLGQPFTDPQNVGVFHELLHAFHATGPFYRFVGLAQLIAAVLLMTQRFATFGAALLLPIIAAITVLCWSTAGIPTITTATLMLLGIIGLLLWDLQKWRAIFSDDECAASFELDPIAPVIDSQLWRWCGLGILAIYLVVCAVQGGIYRPRGLELDNPAFYLFPSIILFPVVTWLIDRARYRRRND